MKPVQCERSNLLQCSRFLKEMRGGRDDDELFGTSEQGEGLTIQLDDRQIVSSDNEQRRRSHIRQVRCGEIRSSASRHHCRHPVQRLRRCLQGGSRSGTGSEIAKP